MKASTPKLDLSDIRIGSRARILGTIVNRYVTGDRNYGFLVIDDTTDTIRVKVFKNAEILRRMKIGDLVDVFGNVEEYEDEIYIKPELIKRVHDPNWYLVRRLELLKSEKPAEEKVLNMLKDSSEGVELSVIMKRLNLNKEEVQSALSRLMIQGAVYEPSTSVFKLTEEMENEKT